MGTGSFKNDVAGPLMQNIGHFAVALLILYFAKRFILWLKENGEENGKKICPCFY